MMYEDGIRDTVNALRENNADYVIAQDDCYDLDGNFCYVYPPQNIAEDGLLGKIPGFHGATIISSKVFDKLGYYDVKHKVVADYKFLLMLNRDKEFKRCDLNKSIHYFELGGVSFVQMEQTFNDVSQIISEFIPENCHKYINSLMSLRWSKPLDDKGWNDLECMIESGIYNDLQKKYLINEMISAGYNGKYKSRPLVSIITPSYNQGEFIKETIDSVLSQDYPNIEYIVMDAVSTDNTVDVLKSYGDKFTWVSEKDDGQADAVNKGIKLARGEIIGWLNSDDTYYPGAVTEIVDFFISNPDVDLVYGEANFTHKDGSFMCRYGTEDYNRERMAHNCIICQPAAFFRKKAIEDVGYLNVSLQCCMDYELWMRLGLAHKLKYIPKLLATSRMYDENKTTARYNEMCAEIFSCLIKYYGYVPLEWINRYAKHLSDTKGKRGYKQTAIRLFIKENKHNPRYMLKIILNSLKTRLNYRMRGQRYTGKYDDNWVQRVYIEYIDTGTKDCKAIRINGDHRWPMSKNLILNVYINSKQAAKEVITDKGEFLFDVPVKHLNEDGIVKLKIMSNAKFCPLKIGTGEDSRWLSYMLNGVELVY